MSQADILLDNLTEEEIAALAETPIEEPHIVIDANRFITVPDELKRLGVQYDHNIETVTFDMPRYWDGNDLSEMTLYINYMLSSREPGSHIVDKESINVDPTDSNVVHFDWTISGHVTKAAGNLAFLVCAKTVDDNGDEALHWNSELCTDCYISEGLESTKAIIEKNADVITQLLLKMSIFETEWTTFENHIREQMDSFVAGTGFVSRYGDDIPGPLSVGGNLSTPNADGTYTVELTDTDKKNVATKEYVNDGIVKTAEELRADIAEAYTLIFRGIIDVGNSNFNGFTGTTELNRFNRTPVVGDRFNAIYRNSSGKMYYNYATVYSVDIDAGTVTYKSTVSNGVWTNNAVQIAKPTSSMLYSNPNRSKLVFGASLTTTDIDSGAIVKQGSSLNDGDVSHAKAKVNASGGFEITFIVGFGSANNFTLTNTMISCRIPTVSSTPASVSAVFFDGVNLNGSLHKTLDFTVKSYSYTSDNVGYSGLSIYNPRVYDATTGEQYTDADAVMVIDTIKALTSD